MKSRSWKNCFATEVFISQKKNALLLPLCVSRANEHGQEETLGAQTQSLRGLET